MQELLSVLKESIVKAPVRHAVGVSTTAAGTAEAATGPLDHVHDAPAWVEVLSILPLGEIAAMAGICVSCAVFYKTWLEIQHLKNKDKD